MEYICHSGDSLRLSPFVGAGCKESAIWLDKYPNELSNSPNLGGLLIL